MARRVFRCSGSCVGRNADQIAPNLWQGAVPHFGEGVAQAGFNVLVLTATEHQKSSVYYPDVRVLHAPNDDSSERPLTRPKLQTAVRAATQVAEAIRTGQKVLVTCAQGMNRSGFVTAMALHLLYGVSGDQAIRWVRAKRRKGYDGYRPLSNGQFNEFLRRLPAEAPKMPAPELQGGFLNIWNLDH